LPVDMATKGTPCSSANRRSTPFRPPIQSNSCANPRRLSSSTTAIAGRTCPPVPPPAIRILVGRS
jgi:hypothetical protein